MPPPMKKRGPRSSEVEFTVAAPLSRCVDALCTHSDRLMSFDFYVNVARWSPQEPTGAAAVDREALKKKAAERRKLADEKLQAEIEAEAQRAKVGTVQWTVSVAPCCLRLSQHPNLWK